MTFLLDEKIAVTRDVIEIMLKKMEDSTTKQILEGVMKLLHQMHFKNTLWIMVNLYKIGTIEEADEEQRKILQPILDMISKDKTPEFVV